jgi:hypothetical protein
MWISCGPCPRDKPASRKPRTTNECESSGSNVHAQYTCDMDVCAVCVHALERRGGRAILREDCMTRALSRDRGWVREFTVSKLHALHLMGAAGQTQPPRALNCASAGQVLALVDNCVRWAQRRLGELPHSHSLSTTWTTRHGPVLLCETCTVKYCNELARWALAKQPHTASAAGLWL